jgi:hypothetical protein
MLKKSSVHDGSLTGMAGISELKLLQIAREWVAGEYTLDDMVERLRPYYDQEEALRVGQNAITKIRVQDTLARMNEVGGGGIDTVLVWETMQDGHVCKVCAGLHEKPQGGEWQDYPPHGCISARGCRCNIRLKVRR